MNSPIAFQPGRTQDTVMRNKQITPDHDDLPDRRLEDARALVSYFKASDISVKLVRQPDDHDPEIHFRGKRPEYCLQIGHGCVTLHRIFYTEGPRLEPCNSKAIRCYVGDDRLHEVAEDAPIF